MKNRDSVKKIVSQLAFEKQEFSGELSSHAATIAKQKILYHQLSPGHYKGLFGNIISHPLLQVYYKSFNMNLMQHGSLPEEQYTLVVKISGPVARLSGSDLQPRAMMIFKPGVKFDSYVPKNSESLLFYLPEKWVYKLVSNYAIDPASIEDKPDSVLIEDENKFFLILRMLHQINITQLTCLSDSPSINPVTCYIESLTQMIIGFLVECWTSHNTANKIDQKDKLLSRAQAITRSCKGIDLSPETLAKDIGVSRRKLEYLFRSYFNVSPAEYIRIIKLNELRKALLNKDFIHLSIGDVASELGIWHLGRLAKNYRNHFGELPSETRSRITS